VCGFERRVQDLGLEYLGLEIIKGISV